MCRITKKSDGSNGRDYVPLSSFGYVIDQDAINKLGRLEDFEEKVGKSFDEYLDDNVLYQNYKRLEEKLWLLERENKALDEEGVMKCELNEKLEKALDKACVYVAHFQKLALIRGAISSMDEMGEEQWKAWCLDENV